MRNRDIQTINDKKNRREWGRYSADILNECIDSENWDVIMNTENINIAVNTFTENSQRIIDKICPMRNVARRVRFKNYISRDTMEKRRNRDDAWKRYVRDKSQEYWENFKKFRNIYSKGLKMDKGEKDEKFS